MREAAARGDARRAYGLAEQALTLLDQLPAAPTHGLLRAQLLLEKGRLQWHGSLLGSAFTLQEALASLEAAKALSRTTSHLRSWSSSRQSPLASAMT